MRRFTSLIVLQVVAALGIAGWWVYWFASGSYRSGAPCDLAYENAFPVGDLVLAGLLGLTAWRVHRGSGRALWVGFVASGMALSLAGLDTTHNLLTGGFSGSVGTIVQKLVFAVVNSVVAVLTLRTLTGNAGAFSEAPSLRLSGASARVVGALGLSALVGALAYWALVVSRPECLLDVERSWLGPGLVAGGLGLAVVARGRAAPRWPAALALAGCFLHAGAVLALLACEQGRLDQGCVAVALLVAGVAVVGAARR